MHSLSPAAYCLPKGLNMTEQELAGSKAIERSIVKKLMWGLVPFLAILYMFNMLDRGNVSIAVLTMQKDLHFSDSIYGLGAGIFFVGYFLLEVPSNLIMERVGARRWIARIMISWGVISASMMFVRTPISFYSLRFLLGLAEAGFYPGIILYITYWVPGSVRTQVLARFLALTAFLGTLGPLLGGLLLTMDGFYGLHGWQWLFLLEGLPSVVLGFVVLMVLPDNPMRANWLSPSEKSWIATSLAREDNNALRVHHPSLRTVIGDPRILHLCLIFIVTSIAGNSVGFFGPKLVQSRSAGQWSNSSVVFSLMIPAIVGAIAMMIAAVHSDRTGNRRAHVALGYFIAGLGFLACVYAPTAPLVLVALSVNALGERCAAGSYWAVTTDLMGARAAAGGIAFINSVGNLGGFIGPWLMGTLKEHSHSYTPGLYTAAALMVLGACLSFLLRRHSKPNPIALADGSPILSEDDVAAVAQPEQTAP
jgi:ACS family tartrate transporter-like MFS transporter